MSKRQSTTTPAATMTESEASRQYPAPLRSFSELHSWKSGAMDSELRKEMDAQLAADPALRARAIEAVLDDLARWGCLLLAKRGTKVTVTEQAAERELIAAGRLAERSKLFKQTIKSLDDAQEFVKAANVGRIALDLKHNPVFHFQPGPTPVVLVRVADEVADRFATVHGLPATVSWTADGWRNWLLSARAGCAEGIRCRVYGLASVTAKAAFDHTTMSPLRDVVLQADGRLPAAPERLARLLAIVGGASGDVDEALLHGV